MKFAVCLIIQQDEAGGISNVVVLSSDICFIE